MARFRRKFRRRTLMHFRRFRRGFKRRSGRRYRSYKVSRGGIRL